VEGGEPEVVWEDVATFYAELARQLGQIGREDRPGRAMRATLLLRRAHALMNLRRWDDARLTIDEALYDAKASEDGGVVAQAYLAAGVYAANVGDHARGERFMMEALERYHESDERPSLQGRGWCFLNLAGLYAKTGRVDLAFVTFQKAREVLGVAENWAGVAASWEAQAQVRRALGDEDRWREDLMEAIIFYDRDRMREKADRLRALIGRAIV
jgi:tetratricopeptide (TPR) repeat protein